MIIFILEDNTVARLKLLYVFVVPNGSNQHFFSSRFLLVHVRAIVSIIYWRLDIRFYL